MKISTDLGAADEGRIVALSGGRAILSTSQPVGVMRQAFERMNSAMQPTADSCDVGTNGECSVRTSTCVAGDWFTSDGAGLAVKTESGFALGRILQNPVDGLALCVVSPITL